MSDMDMSSMSMTGMYGPYAMSREASGTSWQPDAAGHHGVHATGGAATGRCSFTPGCRAKLHSGRRRSCIASPV